MKITLTLLVTVFLATPSCAWRHPDDTRPNIVLFYPDTIRADALSTYGSKISLTPNYDRLAAKGVLFEEAHVQHTQCAPSRCALLTGRYMHVYGHRTQTNLVKPWEDNIFSYLKSANYTTMLLGKNDMLATDSFNQSLTFWTNDIGVESGANAFKLGEAGYYSFAASDTSKFPGNNSVANGDLRAVELLIDWMNAPSTPEPFAVMLSGLGAHPPYGAPPDYYSKYNPTNVCAQSPPKTRQAGDNKPPHLGPDGINTFRNLTSFNESFYCELMSVYYGRISYTDFVLGQLLDGVEASALASNTVLVAHSDHGDYNSDYGAVEKWPGGMEDSLTHVPLIIAAPGGASNIRVSQPVMSIDLLPTFLQLAQINTSAISVQFGLSLLPWVMTGKPPTDPTTGIHQYVFSEGGYSNYNEYEPNDPAQAALYADPSNLYYPRGKEEITRPFHIDRVIMMRNSTAKLVYRPRGVSEFYDLVADEDELWNVYENVTYSALRNAMTADLLSWLVLTSDVTPLQDDERNSPVAPTPPFPWPPAKQQQQQQQQGGSGVGEGEVEGRDVGERQGGVEKGTEERKSSRLRA